MVDLVSRKEIDGWSRDDDLSYQKDRCVQWIMRIGTSLCLTRLSLELLILHVEVN